MPGSSSHRRLTTTGRGCHGDDDGYHAYAPGDQVMSGCQCSEQPLCQERWCENVACWSVQLPKWRREIAPRFKFMCDTHYQIFRSAISSPIRGVDQPEAAPEDWRPSILEMMRHANIAISFGSRQQVASSQQRQLSVLRKHIALSRPHRGGGK